jgi:isochorismate pyruvate lyase
MVVKCRNLGEVRDNIDRLDRQIVPLLAERAGYVRQAAGFKQTKAAVVDQARIEAIVLKVRHMAMEESCDPDVIERIYRSMIDAFIIFESKEWMHIHDAKE